MTDYRRVLGLDFGSKTVGVALSDPLRLTAQGLEIIRRDRENKLRRSLARIQELVEEHDVSTIVLGLPRNMNGSIGERAVKSIEFSKLLEKRCGCPVVLWDERLTTVAADRTMMESGVRREDRKDYVDKIAAMLILQGYLDNLNSGRKMPELDGDALLSAYREAHPETNTMMKR